MKVRLWRSFCSALAVGVGVGLWMAPLAQAQPDLEMFLTSYSNANITIDGNTDDWNLSQFTTRTTGGTNPSQSIISFNDDGDWTRTPQTGDVAYAGWDDTNENLLYGARVGAWAFPENPDGTLAAGATDSVPTGVVDLAATVYARHNTTHQYFLAVVEDDEVNTTNGETGNPASGPNGAAWLNDSVEFFINPDGLGGPRDLESDVQLVIDAGGQVQVWDSSPEYQAQIEAGVDANVTLTDTGYMIEVGIDKSVFATPLPADLGPAGPAGSNFLVDFHFRDMDDPFDTKPDDDNDNAYSSVLFWAKTLEGAEKEPAHYGQLIHGDGGGDSSIADLNTDGFVDGLDLGILLGEWNPAVAAAMGIAGGAAVPEPTSLALIAIGVLGLGCCRRQ